MVRESKNAQWLHDLFFITYSTAGPGSALVHRRIDEAPLFLRDFISQLARTSSVFGGIIKNLDHSYQDIYKVLKSEIDPCDPANGLTWSKFMKSACPTIAEFFPALNDCVILKKETKDAIRGCMRKDVLPYIANLLRMHDHVARREMKEPPSEGVNSGEVSLDGGLCYAG
jgi:hypothetical protein